MKRLIGIIGDRVQATFPPNRVAILAAVPLNAAAVWLSTWTAAHVPGVELSAGVIAGAMGAALLILNTLLYKWFDQWQKGEQLTVDEDLNHALDELDQATTMFFAAHGTVQGVGAALEDLHERISKGSINEAEVANGIAGILDVIGQFVETHSVEEPTSTEVVGPPVPVAAPPVEEAPVPAESAPPAAPQGE